MAYSPQQRRQGRISETLEISELTDHSTDVLGTRTDLSTHSGQRNYFRHRDNVNVMAMFNVLGHTIAIPRPSQTVKNVATHH